MSVAAIIAFTSAFLGTAVGLISVVRQRRSLAQWLFAVGMLLLAIESVFSGLLALEVREYSLALGKALDPSILAGTRERIIHWENWRLVALAFLPGIWLTFSVTYARGNYREFLTKWTGALLGATAFSIALVLFFWGGLIAGAIPSDDVTAEEWMFPLTEPGRILYFIRLLSAIFILMQLERTFWAAVGTMRWRIKFMMLGLGVLFAVQVYTSSQALLLAIPATKDGVKVMVTGPEFSAAIVGAGALLLGSLLVLRSLFRGSSEVAVYPTQSGLHKSVSVIVAGAYLLIVGIFAKVVRSIGLTDDFSFRAFLILVLLVLATVLLLSDRVQLYARRFISRYLQRPTYDYRTVWRRFTEGTARRLTQEELSQASVKLVADIFQALSVSVWLVDDQKENLTFVASTSLSEATAQKVQATREEGGLILAAMRQRLEPVDIETSSEPWAVVLRRCHPSEFERAGNRICVPMVAAGELLGVMILGDRVGGVFFSLEDFDLLKCVGDQVAAGLLNSQLSQKLLQAKELEAFQTMSAFFVHDLKNTASTLNLMLQNLPVHFDNPAFRADALRGIAKSGQHINNLLGRLSVLRHDLQIRPVESDLNEVVAKVLTSWDGATKVRLIRNLGAVPTFAFDQEQILKVVTNLVLNASEAVAGDGQIRVETERSNGWVVLTVADNGCGMAPDFLNRSLFRPFQTTKKEGFGIGMFQSKMIVEAHGGRVEVESEQKKGTTFRVLLPFKKANE